MVATEQDGNVRQGSDLFVNLFKPTDLVIDLDIAKITDPKILKSRPVLAEGSHMRRPEANSFGAERRAFARTCRAVIRDTHDSKIGFGGGKIGAVQVGPKSVCRIRVQNCSLY